MIGAVGEAAPARPPRERLAERVTAAVFRRVARRRADRAVHATGRTLSGRLEMVPSITGVGAAVFDRSDPQPVLVRLSRAVGLPRRLPDVHGIGIRLLDAYGPGRHQDLLLDSCGRPPLHRLPVPRRTLGGPYGSLVSHRVGRHRTLLRAVFVEPAEPPADLDAAARLAARGELRLRLDVGGRSEPPLATGTIVLDGVVAAAVERGLRFEPASGSAGLQPASWLNRVRQAAYAASRWGSRFGRRDRAVSSRPARSSARSS